MQMICWFFAMFLNFFTKIFFVKTGSVIWKFKFNYFERDERDPLEEFENGLRPKNEILEYIEGQWSELLERLGLNIKMLKLFFYYYFDEIKRKNYKGPEGAGGGGTGGQRSMSLLDGHWQFPQFWPTRMKPSICTHFS